MYYVHTHIFLILIQQSSRNKRKKLEHQLTASTRFSHGQVQSDNVDRMRVIRLARSRAEAI